jgi:hypothetical protein
VLSLAACTPELNWRDVRPQGAGLIMQMPCRPVHQVRTLRLAERTVAMHVHACDCAGMTFGVGWADVGQPQAVTLALTQLASGAAANLQAAPRVVSAAAVPGMTPNAAAQRIALAGHLPQGAPAQAELIVFAHGTRAYQATVLGQRLEPAAVQQFVDALAVQP